MSRPRLWHRIRFGLLLVSLPLLGLPWAGYRFIQETEHFLRDAQDRALQTTASSVANVLHGHAAAFHGVARPGSLLTFRNLFLHALDEPPQIDGYRDDWVHTEHNFSVLQSVDDSLEARMLLGRHGRYIYLLLGVKDPLTEYGENGDAVDLAVTDSEGVLQRYRIQPQAPGWVTAQRLGADDAPQDPVEYEPAIRGEWQNDAQGYTLELRLPRELLYDRLSVRVFESRTRQVLASGHLFPAGALGRIVERSAALERVLASVTPPATRVWVTDHQGLVLAQAGRLDANAPLSADRTWMPWFMRELLLAVLPREADSLGDLPDDQTHLFVRPVVDALSGRPAGLRRQPRYGDAVVVSAAVPIRSSEGIRGAVLVEQTTNAVLSVHDLALQRLFGITLLFFTLSSLGLLLFAGLLASRISRLRDRVEAAVSHDGRIIGRLEGDLGRDEIGDLGRSIARVLDRLTVHDHGLEAMASQPADGPHTPPTASPGSSDPAGQAMRRDGPEWFDLAAMLRQRVEDLRGIHAGLALELRGAGGGIRLYGVADLIGQAVDTLIGHAVDSHLPGSTITVDCRADRHSVHLTVFHEGPPLPVDVDPFQAAQPGLAGPESGPQFGQGLYRVRLIGGLHGGRVAACNRSAPDGVAVTLSLPLISS